MLSRFALAACCLAAGAQSASACGCEPLTTKESRKRADLVFTGTVIDSHRELSLEVESEWRVRLKVESFWKGDPGDEVVVYTGGPCPVTFNRGEKYLVFAVRQEGRGRLITDTCRSTGSLEIRAGEVEKLGKPKRRPPREN